MKIPATTLGKTIALAELRLRRKLALEQKPIDNGLLPAGSPIFFTCTACGLYISHPEAYIERQKFCFECQALLDCGWLE